MPLGQQSVIDAPRPGYPLASWAGRFLDQWCIRMMRFQLESIKKVSRTLRNHLELILYWFAAKGTISAGIVEGFNNKVKLTTQKIL